MVQHSNKRSVLVVDDQDNWRIFLKERLEDDFEVTEATTLAEAMEKALDQKDPPFHVVVTDMRLKDYEKGNEDGMLLAEMLNRLGDTTKVIVVTGFPTLATVKRAFSSLKVYDYLEKAPESGEPFNGKAFRDIVRKAAEEAECERENGFTLERRWVLLVGGAQPWREKMKSLLEHHRYDLDVLENANDLAEYLSANKKDYYLIIFHEDVTSQQAGFFQILDQYLPDGKKIMFTQRDIEPVVRMMQEQVIMNVFTVQGDQYNKAAFEETLHQAFAMEATRYLVLKIYDPADPTRVLAETEPLTAGHTYHLELALQNKRQPGAASLWLLPKPEKRNRVQFKVFFFARQMKFSPDSEAYWEIPISRQVHVLTTQITPQAAGETTISIDLRQDNGWTYRLSRKVTVDPQKSVK
jgi:ActR/RegA family two-component response regulator